MVAYDLAEVEIWVRVPALALWGISSVGRTPRLHRGGLGFKSLILHLISFNGVMETHIPAEVVIWVRVPVRAFSIEVSYRFINFHIIHSFTSILIVAVNATSLP